MVQDYKKMSLKKSVQNIPKQKRKPLGQPTKPRVVIFSPENGVEINNAEIESDWNLIATAKVAPHSFLCLVTMAGTLATISVQLK